MRQAANLASARTLGSQTGVSPTFHSLVTRHGHGGSAPHPRGPQSSAQQGARQGVEECQREAPPEQEAKPRGKKSREDVPHSATVHKKMPAEQNANQTKSIKTRDWLPSPGRQRGRMESGLESALGLSGVCPNSAGGRADGLNQPWSMPASSAQRSSPGQGFPACTGDSPQGPRRCPHITHLSVRPPSIQATSRGLGNPSSHGESRPEVQGELLQAEPRKEVARIPRQGGPGKWRKRGENMQRRCHFLKGAPLSYSRG